MIALFDRHRPFAGEIAPLRPKFAPNVRLENCLSGEELRAALDELEAADDGMRQTVVLVLPDSFRTHLPDIIRRERPGFRLILTSTVGRLPGMATIGDLSLTSAALGWLLITFRRNVDEAIAEAAESLEAEERCVVLFVGPCAG